jgi:hypothetical protein
MNGSRTSRVLLRLYPPAWRARYGEELEELIAQTTEGRVSLRSGLDLARAAVRERLRAAGLAGDGLPPRERARAGALLVLWAWGLFVLAGIAVQKQSEHWQASTPAADRALPAGAFGTLEIAAAIGAVLVVGTLALALPSLVRTIGLRGWNEVRRWLVLSCVGSAIAIAAVAGLAFWAHALATPQRNGHDLAYSAAFIACAIVVAAVLASWAVAVTVAARRLELGPQALHVVARAALGVTVAMAVMTGATVVWWASLVRTTSSPVSSLAIVASAVMAVAATLGGIGSRRSLEAARELELPT